MMEPTDVHDVECSQPVAGQQAAANSSSAAAHAQPQQHQPQVPAESSVAQQMAMVVQMMQLQSQRQEAAELAAEAREADARVREEKARAAAAISQLIKANNKEMARYITAVSMETAASNRATLASAAIEQLGMAEHDEPLDERHVSLKTKIKTMKGLSAEQQDALFSELKATKQRRPEAAAAAAGCTTCHRQNHTADKCYATTNAAGEPIVGAKRARQQAPQPQPQLQGQALFFPPLPMPQFVPQQYMPQQYAQQPAAAAAGGAGVPQQNIVCYTCGVGGHKSFQCPRARAPAGVAAAAAAAAARPAAGGAPNNPIVVRANMHMQAARAETAQLAHGSHSLMVTLCMPMSLPTTTSRSSILPNVCSPLMCPRNSAATDLSISAAVNNATGIAKTFRDGLTNTSTSKPIRETHEVQTHCQAAATAGGSGGVAKMDVDVSANVAASSVCAAVPSAEEGDNIFINHGREESEASAYAAGSWGVEDESDDTTEDMMSNGVARSESKGGSVRSCVAELYSSSLEGTRADTKNSHSNIDLAPVLSSKLETQRSLAALALQGEKMPARTQSLKAAIAGGFGSRKKMLSDEAVLLQMCEKCSKVGHTAFSCPDQTQRAEADRGAADAWVRRLIDLPRVDVLAENAGLTLEQGVAKWRAKGEELNRGNPWEGSTKMEDSLKKQLGYHKAMGMSSVHLGWIGFGIPLRFIEEKHPAPLAFRNHASAMEEQAFVDKEHEANLKNGSFVKVARGALRGICPLQVVKHPVSGKRRLVQDLRWINGHLPNVKFRMESLHKELGDVVQSGDKMLTTDIEKAYYCLAMHPDAQPYLGWEWKGEFYMPTCLVFGLAPAPRIFTKIMRPMMAFFRSLGVRVLGMIDDYLWAERPERIKALREAVRIVFPLLGWRFNAKCEWDPADEVLMLGMLVNAARFQVRAPEKKIQTTIHNIRMILAKQRAQPQRPVTIKDVQRVTGRLMSMMLALPGVRVFSRYLYQCLAVALEGNEQRKRAGQSLVWTVQLTRPAVEELEFWLQRLLTHNGLEINCRENQVQVLLWSDASDVGWGGEAAGAETRVRREDVPRGPIASMASGALPFAEIARSSTRRELVALLKVASTPNILEQIRGRRIRVLMDSQPALANLLKGGGPVPELCEAVRQWVRFCEEHAIRPTYEWVERALNWRADEASKLQSQQHTWKYAIMETALRRDLTAMPATQWRSRANHFVWGKVPLFLPMFHQIDARVEMIRAQLEEAIIVVPRWPAGGINDWWRRIEQHSIARLRLGKVSSVYAERPQTGHDDELEAFWLMGRRGERNREAAQRK